MLNILLAICTISYGVVFALNIPRFYNNLKSLSGPTLWICVAWCALFIGQGQIFSADNTSAGPSLFSAGSLYQISWMFFASTILVILFLNNSIKSAAWKVPVRALFFYAILGLMTAPIAAAPALSVYKSFQVIVDVFMILMAISILKEDGKGRLITELCYFLLGIVILSAAIGGLLVPELAFKDIYGAFTGVLNGVIPQVHANELGLLSAITILISLRRSFEKGGLVVRLFWLTQCALAMMVLFLAQARTSMAGLIIGIFILAIFIKQMRPILIFGMLLGMFAIFYVSIGDLNIGVKGTSTETYLRRGASDEQIETLSGRTGLWKAGFQMLYDSPVIGHGFQSGVRMGGPEYGIPAGTNMHSAHMQVLVDSGLLGYILWLIFVIGAYYALIKQTRRSHLPTKNNVDRFYVETVAVMTIMLFRSFMGHVLVAHQFNLLVFSSFLLVVYAYKSSDVHINKHDHSNTLKNTSGILKRKEISRILNEIKVTKII